MAGWIKSLRQQDGSFVIVIPREVYGTDGKAAIIEDFATRATPLEFANAILRAHGVEPAHVFAAYPVSDPSYVHHATIAPMPAFDPVVGNYYTPVDAATAAELRDKLVIDPEQDDDEGAPGEPPRCKTGGCEG